jgi:hypothetical protein
MSQTLASDMVRKGLSVLLERVERQQDFPPRDVADLLTSCDMTAVFLDRLWQLAQGCLDRGLEGKQLSSLLKELVETLELGIKALILARERMQTAKPPADVSMLERSLQLAAHRRDELVALVSRLETSSRAVALASLPTGRGERESDGYVSLESLQDRLLSGGDR